MNGDVNNLIGDRGEAIFESVMTKFHGAQPIFRRPRFMGEKWPNIDYVCELLGPPVSAVSDLPKSIKF